MAHERTHSQQEFTSEVELQGWSADAAIADAQQGAVPVWLYSYGFQGGPRLVVQLLKDIFEKGLPPEVRASLPGRPVDHYATAIAEFDATPFATPSIEVNQQLAAVLINFARNTRLWDVLPSPHSVPGLHIVVLDWRTTSTEHIVISSAVVQRTVLAPEAVAKTAAAAMAAHLARHPQDQPQPRRGAK